PVRGDELEDAGVLVHTRVGDVPAPADRLVRDAEGTEDLVVELVGLEETVDLAEELARLGALDDPVIVGGGERGDLADRVLGELVLAGALELGRVLHGPDAEDGALSDGEAGHRMHGA